MATTAFQKRKEDFICEKCGRSVQGNGYTNHCPFCLWSKHVDIYPGDRALLESCGGLMRPERVEGSSGSKGSEGYMLVHICEKCGHVKRNHISKNDDFDVVINLIKKIV